MAAPDTPESVAAAAAINSKLEMSDDARAHYEAAAAKMNAQDGKGCLKELDSHDKLDAKHKSTDASSPFAMLRAQCVMLSGKCDAGKVQMRKAFEKTMSQYGPEHIDRTVDAMASMWCQGSMSPTDRVRRALKNLSDGAYMTKKDAAFCVDNYQTVVKYIDKAKPRDADDTQISQAMDTLYHLSATCLGRAGDCKGAYKVYRELMPAKVREGMDKIQDPKQREDVYRNGFESLIRQCKN